MLIFSLVYIRMVRICEASQFHLCKCNHMWLQRILCVPIGLKSTIRGNRISILWIYMHLVKGAYRTVNVQVSYFFFSYSALCSVICSNFSYRRSLTCSTCVYSYTIKSGVPSAFYILRTNENVCSENSFHRYTVSVPHMNKITIYRVFNLVCQQIFA